MLAEQAILDRPPSYSIKERTSKRPTATAERPGGPGGSVAGADDAGLAGGVGLGREGAEHRDVVGLCF